MFFFYVDCDFNSVPLSLKDNPNGFGNMYLSVALVFKALNLLSLFITEMSIPGAERIPWKLSLDSEPVHKKGPARTEYVPVGKISQVYNQDVHCAPIPV
jgi:hypothetical protein